MEKYLSQFDCWMTWHMRLKPWYDAYGGQYKDKYRWWTGFLMLFRCLLETCVCAESISEYAECNIQNQNCLFYRVRLYISRSIRFFTTCIQISDIKLSGDQFLIAYSIDGIFIHHLAEYSYSFNFRLPFCDHLVVSPWPEAEDNKLGDIFKESKLQEKYCKLHVITDEEEDPID